MKPATQPMDRITPTSRARRSAVHGPPLRVRLGREEELHRSQLPGEGGRVQRSLAAAGGAFLQRIL